MLLRIASLVRLINLYRRVVLPLLLFFPVAPCISGTLFVQNITTDSNGVSRATVLYFNDKGQIVPFSLADLTINEGSGIGTARVIDVQCPPVFPAVHVSSVLTIDVSGSMKFGGPNIVLARAAAQAWVEALSDSSECAITVFDHVASLRTGFTRDKADLTKIISDIAPHGGTDYTEGLIDDSEGGIAIASQGSKRRVLVFLTDGYGHVDAQKVIALANKNNVTVYCVTLGMFMPAVLKEIATGTGGLWFDRVTTVDEAIMAYRRIFAHASGASGCTVTWQSPPTCETRRTVTFQIADARYEQSQPVPTQMMAGATFSPLALSFGTDTLNSKYFSVTAGATSVTISTIQVDRPDVFSIDAGLLPATIARGDSLRVRVTRKSSDSAYQVGRVTFNAIPCPLPSFYLTTGSAAIKPLKATLRVVHPNGGERFLVRSQVPIRWEGLPPDVPVRVEVSTNAGFEWTTVTDGGIKNSTIWRATKLPSDSCLARVTHIKDTPQTPNPLIVIPGKKFFRVAFAPDGETIATSEYTGAPGSRAQPPTVKLWNAKTGTLIRELGTGDFLTFAPDGASLAAWDHKSITVFEIPSGKLRWSRSFRSNFINSQIDKYSKVLLAARGGSDTTEIINLLSGSVVNSVPHRGRDVTFASMSPDGKRIALSGRDGSVVIDDLSRDDDSIVIRVDNSKRTFDAVFSPDGNLVALSTDNGASSLWDATTGKRHAEVARRQYINDNTYLAFSPDGYRIAVERATDMTVVYDVATARPVVSMRRASDVGGASGAGFLSNGGLMYISTLSKVTVLNAYTGVQTAVLPRAEGDPTFPADGTRIAVINRDLNVAIYALNEPLLQQDVSDNLWALYRPTGKMQDVVFAGRFVGQAFDTIVSAAIENTSVDTLIVNNLIIESGNVGDFSISSESELVIPPKQTAAISFSFHPRAVGRRNAVASAATNGGRITASLSGVGLKSVIGTDADTIDLGTYPVGIVSQIVSDSILRNLNDLPITITSIKLLSSADKSLSLTSTTPIVVNPNSYHTLTFSFAPTSVRDVRRILEVTTDQYSEPIHITAIAHAADTGPSVSFSDPTTFRSIILPTSIVPRQGTVTTGIYDVLGLQAGYSVTDNLMVFAGGALPLPNRWLGATGYDASLSSAWSVGGKYGMFVDSLLSVGGGYAFGKSYYDQDITKELESTITFNSLWATAGYGTDDSRLNLYAGYAFKRHVTAFEGEYSANAVIFGVAYDYRFAAQWKISSEAFYMRSMSFVPITITARYFRSTDAFEIGFTIIGISASGSAQADIPIIPMLSWVKRW
ncbi:MAG: VWA domain-containing protein [Ignavibacteria bacterium]|nr:VWA domain-containing protein [Ignavibacteria bacterium]